MRRRVKCSIQTKKGGSRIPMCSFLIGANNATVGNLATPLLFISPGGSQKPTWPSYFFLGFSLPFEVLSIKSHSIPKIRVGLKRIASYRPPRPARTPLANMRSWSADGWPPGGRRRACFAPACLPRPRPPKQKRTQGRTPLERQARKLSCVSAEPNEGSHSQISFGCIAVSYPRRCMSALCFKSSGWLVQLPKLARHLFML
jgi:hypothetical protein